MHRRPGLPEHHHAGRDDDDVEAGEGAEDKIGRPLHLRAAEDGDADAVAHEPDHADQVQKDAVEDKLKENLVVVILAVSVVRFETGLVTCRRRGGGSVEHGGGADVDAVVLAR
jgi:hypothetical protein